MDAIGNEVGQKMRSAIKAKLMELGCYVDDELPDYIMVMVANKRTKIQMNSDLQLFLRENTREFVDWLQQVLKKLKEVRITNPELYACSSFGELKRKASQEIAECVIKKEKKDKKVKIEKKDIGEPVPNVRSLSDDIPVKATKLVEKLNVKNHLVGEPSQSKSTTENPSRQDVSEDNFDIPSLSEVNLLQESELEVVANKIKKARNRLVLMKSDSEDEDFINIKADAEELLGNELCDISSSTNVISETTISIPIRKKAISLKRQHSTISKVATVAISNERAESDLRNTISNMKTSILERLGKRPTNSTRQDETTLKKRSMISLAKTLREEKEISGRIISSVIYKPTSSKELPRKRESVHKRLGVPSSVVALPKRNERKEMLIQPTVHEAKVIPSVVQIKPRKPVVGVCQANKNLLLKAVAEAQKSVSQITPRGTETRPEVSQNKKALFTKRYREQHNMTTTHRKVSPDKTNDITSKVQKQNIIIEVKGNKSQGDEDVEDESNVEYIPEPLKAESEKGSDETEYVPSAIDLTFDEDLDKYIEDLDSTNGNHSVEESDEQEVAVSETNHQFIVTLDGIRNKEPLKNHGSLSPTSTTNIGDSPPQLKRHPSPIIFDKKENRVSTKLIRKIPDILPKVSAPVSTKTKDRCKYWPTCRLGDLCEYVHPNTQCKMFPVCKFGDRCLYLHPKCKFYASCTRKDCPYSHGAPKVILKPAIKPSIPYHVPTKALVQEVCKFFPNCTNLNCVFYHPRPCRFGVNCLNKSECNFSHSKVPSKEKLTWHSHVR